MFGEIFLIKILLLAMIFVDDINLNQEFLPEVSFS